VNFTEVDFLVFSHQAHTERAFQQKAAMPMGAGAGCVAPAKLDLPTKLAQH